MCMFLFSTSVFCFFFCSDFFIVIFYFFPLFFSSFCPISVSLFLFFPFFFLFFVFLPSYFFFMSCRCFMLVCCGVFFFSFMFGCSLVFFFFFGVLCFFSHLIVWSRCMYRALLLPFLDLDAGYFSLLTRVASAYASSFKFTPLLPLCQYLEFLLAFQPPPPVNGE